MGKHPAKKQILSWKDWLFWYCSVFGAILVLISCAPPVPWRYAMASSSFGQRFIVDRTMGLFTVSNQYGQATAWFKMKSEVCRKMEDFNRPNPLAAGLAIGSMMMASQSDGDMSAGGAVLGCASWPACKEHVATRCVAYTHIAVTGMVSGLLILLGGIAAAMGTVFMVKEGYVKKKKKREEAQWNTALASIFAFVLPFFGTMCYMMGTGMFFKQLQNNAHYPYPGAYIGMYVSLLGELLLFIAMVCGIRRQDYYQVEEKEEEEIYAPGMEQQAGMYPPGMMMPPGGYPGMMAPGMAIGGMPSQNAPPPPPMYAR